LRALLKTRFEIDHERWWLTVPSFLFLLPSVAELLTERVAAIRLTKVRR